MTSIKSEESKARMAKVLDRARKTGQEHAKKLAEDLPEVDEEDVADKYNEIVNKNLKSMLDAGGFKIAMKRIPDLKAILYQFWRWETTNSDSNYDLAEALAKLEL